MEFIEYAISWCRGEIFEGRLILISGLVLAFCAYLFFKFGTTTYAKELFLPLLILGVFFIGTGVTMNISNEKRIEKFSLEYQASKEDFIKSEKNRVENFMTWYPKVKLSMSIIMALAILVYLLGGIKIQSYALIFMLFAFSGFMIDHFSKERAEIYYEKIIEYSEGIK